MENNVIPLLNIVEIIVIVIVEIVLLYIAGVLADGFIRELGRVRDVDTRDIGSLIFLFAGASLFLGAFIFIGAIFYTLFFIH